MAYSFQTPFEKLWILIKEVYQEILEELYTKEEFWEEISVPALNSNDSNFYEF